MARKSESKTIEGMQYTVTQLGAIQGRDVLAKLVKMVGGLANLEKDPGTALNSLDEVQLGVICDVFSRATDVHVSAKQAPRLSDIFDEHFAGNYESMVAWLAFAVQVNYAGFFRKMSGEGMSALALEMTGKTPPSESQKD